MPHIEIGLNRHAINFEPIDATCPCPTCSSGTSRALLHSMITHETVAAHGKSMCFMTFCQLSYHLLSAITQHNIVFQARLMGRARDAIIADAFPDFLKVFFKDYFGESGYPKWCIDALMSVGVDLLEGKDNEKQTPIKVVEDDGARWEYSLQT